MKTRKGGNLVTRVGRAMGLYHEPSTSNLMRNLFAIHEQKYVNIRPLMREWAVESKVPKIVKIEGETVEIIELLLDPRYEQVFLEIYCKVFYGYTQPFSIIVGFKQKVEDFIKSKKRQDDSVIETLILYVQKYLSRDREIPSNAYDYIMDWIDYMETFQPTGEISRLKKAIEGKRSNKPDPRWEKFLNMSPKAPKAVRVGGDPEGTYAPDPFVFKIFISVAEFLIRVLIALLTAGMVS